jgi:hypothetical protein
MQHANVNITTKVDMTELQLQLDIDLRLDPGKRRADAASFKPM